MHRVSLLARPGSSSDPNTAVHSRNGKLLRQQISGFKVGHRGKYLSFALSLLFVSISLSTGRRQRNRIALDEETEDKKVKTEYMVGGGNEKNVFL